MKPYESALKVVIGVGGGKNRAAFNSGNDKLVKYLFFGKVAINPWPATRIFYPHYILEPLPRFRF